MNELSFLALAFRLGLLGFVEPCSLGANGIFLSYLREKDRAARFRETVKFALSRSVVLSALGGVPAPEWRRVCEGFTLRWKLTLQKSYAPEWPEVARRA